VIGRIVRQGSVAEYIKHKRPVFGALSPIVSIRKPLMRRWRDLRTAAMDRFPPFGPYDLNGSYRVQRRRLTKIFGNRILTVGFRA
jgi:hypothetical protein